MDDKRERCSPAIKLQTEDSHPQSFLNVAVIWQALEAMNTLNLPFPIRTFLQSFSAIATF